MALSFEETVADGSSDLINVPFDYLLRKHIHVLLDGIEEPQANLTFINDNTIQLDHIPAAGTLQRVERRTPIDTLFVEFQPGPFSHLDLNRNSEWLMLFSQEASDAVDEAVEKSEAAESFADVAKANARAAQRHRKGATADSFSARGSASQAKAAAASIEGLLLQETISAGQGQVARRRAVKAADRAEKVLKKVPLPGKILPPVSKASAEAGTSSRLKLWSPQRIKEAILALAAGAFKGITDNADAPAIIISSDEEVTMPSQPAFLAFNSVTDTDVTGAGTSIRVEFDSEAFDQGGDYDNAADIFTAPITGRYAFATQVEVGGLDTATVNEITLSFIASNRTARYTLAGTPVAQQSVNFQALIDMDALDTVEVRILVGGMASDTADVIGSSELRTFHSGFLVA